MGTVFAETKEAQRLRCAAGVASPHERIVIRILHNMMTNRVFIISDTHFGHKKVIQFEAEHRPFATIEEHDRALVERWNATVRQKDTVWHLGDVFFGGRDAHGILAALNGIKRLVLGNHDVYPLEVYQRYFGKIFGAAELRGCILTHVPAHPCQLDKRYKANIHGHMHSKKMDDSRYICVSVEQTELKPVLLDEILQTYNAAVHRRGQNSNE